MQKIAIELRLALLLKTYGHIEIRLGLAGQQRQQEFDDRRRDVRIDHEIRTREAEHIGEIRFAQQQRVHIKPAPFIIEDRDGEWHLLSAVDELADDIGRLIAEKRRAEHRDMEILLPLDERRRVLLDGPHQVDDIPAPVRERQAESEALQHVGNDLIETVAAGIINPIDGRIGFDMLSGYRGPHEDISVVVIPPVKQPAKNGIVEGFRKLRLPMLVQELHVLDLDLLPEPLVQLGDRQLIAQLRDGLADP